MIHAEFFIWCFAFAVYCRADFFFLQEITFSDKGLLENPQRLNASKFLRCSVALERAFMIARKRQLYPGYYVERCVSQAFTKDSLH